MAAAHRVIWTSGQMAEVSVGVVACGLSSLCARGGAFSLSATRGSHVECDMERIDVAASAAHTSPDIVAQAPSHLRDSHAGGSTPRGHLSLLLSHLASTDNPTQLGGQAQQTCSRVRYVAATSASPPPPPLLIPPTTLPSSTSPSLRPARRVNPLSFSAFPAAHSSSPDVTCQAYGGEMMNRSRAAGRAWAAATATAAAAAAAGARDPMSSSSSRRGLRSLTASPADRRRLFTTRHVEEEQSVDEAMAAAREEIDDINQKFAEAREEIEMAMESKETIYFNEEAESARKACSEAIDAYQGLLSKLGEKARGALQRSMGLKMEQLKAELGQLKESDH